MIRSSPPKGRKHVGDFITGRFKTPLELAASINGVAIATHVPGNLVLRHSLHPPLPQSRCKLPVPVLFLLEVS